MVADPRRTIDMLERLRALGLTIGVDDFGTGHSALAYLRRLPVGEIKVDKSFVLSMTSDPSSEAIVRTVVDLARNLDLPVIAEGVEEDEVRDRLAAMGCRAAQGYLFSRPLPANGVTELLQSGLTDVPTQRTPSALELAAGV